MADTLTERWFPLQSEREYAKPQRTSIPWSVAEIAYGAYAAKYGRSQSLERLAERGGFYPSEMDVLYPAWFAHADETTTLRVERDDLRTRLANAEKRADDLAAEVVAVLDGLPGAVRVREGGGPENVAASLAASVSALARRATKADADLKSALTLAHLRGEALTRIKKLLDTHACATGDCDHESNKACTEDLVVSLVGYSNDIDSALASTGDPSLVVVRLPDEVAGAWPASQHTQVEVLHVGTDTVEVAIVRDDGTATTGSIENAARLAACLLAAARAAQAVPK